MLIALPYAFRKRKDHIADREAVRSHIISGRNGKQLHMKHGYDPVDDASEDDDRRRLNYKVPDLPGISLRKQHFDKYKYHQHRCHCYVRLIYTKGAHKAAAAKYIAQPSQGPCHQEPHRSYAQEHTYPIGNSRIPVGNDAGHDGSGHDCSRDQPCKYSPYPEHIYHENSPRQDKGKGKACSQRLRLHTKVQPVKVNKHPPAYGYLPCSGRKIITKPYPVIGIGKLLCDKYTVKNHRQHKPRKKQPPVSQKALYR